MTVYFLNCWRTQNGITRNATGTGDCFRGLATQMQGIISALTVRGERTMPRCIYADQLMAAVYDAFDDILEIHDRGAVISEKFRRLIDAQKTSFKGF